MSASSHGRADTEPSPVCSIPETAHILHLSADTVRRYIADGTLPAFRVGPKHIRVRRADIDALMQPIPAGGAA